MRILIAEDEPAYRDLLAKLLVQWGYEVVAVRDGNEACRLLLAGGAPKLAILDWKMPGMEGVEVCRRVRSTVKEPYIYLILLTAQQRDEDLVAGMEAGADDYLLKPFKLNELRVRLRAGRRIIELQDELLMARETFQVKAMRDSLTGLLNHEEILATLDKELARGDRDGVCVSVIMADIDHFKKVNDTFGHIAGDVVLRQTAGKMHSMLRSYDAIGRYGGEEFLIILSECCKECAVALAKRLCSSIGSERVDTPEGAISVTISLGIASAGGNRGKDGLAIIKAADAALYEAKKNGRNRVEMAAG